MIKITDEEKGPICPICGSRNIDELREIYGPIWCNDCGYRVEKKEIFDEFRDNGLIRQLTLEYEYD